MTQKLNSHRKTHQIYFCTPQHTLQEGESQSQEGQLCIEHSCPIQYICFSCCNRVLCAQCIASTSHLHHDLKNIERSRQFLKTQLQEWNIRLQSKSELLDVLHDQLRNNRADIFKYAELYKERIAAQLEQLSKKLEERLESIYTDITQFTSDYKNDSNQKGQRIRLRRIEISNMLQISKTKLEHTSVQHQAQFYCQKKDYIDNLLQEAEIVYYKQQAIEPHWGIDSDLFKNIQHLLAQLTITFKYPIHKDPIELKEKVRESLKKSAKKSKKDLKIGDTDKIERPESKGRHSNANSINTFLATFTPKNASKQRKLKAKKSPGDTLLKKRKKSTPKIESMPSSPGKQVQTTVQISPDKSHKNLFKKK